MKRIISACLLLMIVAVVAFATTTTILYATNVTETCTLANLSSASARQCALVNNNNSTNDVEDQVYVKFKTGASPSAQGTVTVYAYACLAAGANCTGAGEITGTDAAVTIPTTGTILPLAVGPQTCWANVGATTYICGPYSIAQTWNGTMPTGWGIVVQNNSGAAFDVTCTGCGVFYDRVRLQNQ